MRRVLLAWFAVLALVAGCAGTPPPDWAIAAQGSRTGRVDLLARAELTRCATRVASLVFEPCTGFEALLADAPAAERAYADFLAGRVAADDIALLPPQHRAVAAAGVPVPLPDAEPLAQLVAAGVLLQTGRADARVVAQAVDARLARRAAAPSRGRGRCRRGGARAAAPRRRRRLRRRRAALRSPRG